MGDSYVNIDIARLLRQKGFDWLTYGRYYETKDGDVSLLSLEDDCLVGSCLSQNSKLSSGEWSCPTYQAVLRWLREEKRIFIEVRYAQIQKNGKMRDLFIGSVEFMDERRGSITGKVFTHSDYSYDGAIGKSLLFVLQNLL